MTDLPDINVWLALADANHPHFDAAQAYWHSLAASEIAFCRITMLGFLRLATQSGVLSRRLTPPEAWQAYRNFLAVPGFRFLDEPAGTESQFESLADKTGFPHRLWTDTYMAAFALAGGHRLVSFDTDFRQFSGLNFLQLRTT